MTRRHKFLGLALILSTLALVLFAASRTSEPRYNGRPLSSWLQQHWQTGTMETQRVAEIEAAIRAIGAENALPTLLSLVKTKHSPARAWIIDKAERYHIRFLHLQSADDCRLQGIAGFEVLGTNCAPAVRELTLLLADKELAFVAARCLGSIEKPAEAALCQCLTNADSQVRCWSVNALASATDDVEVYINRIKPCLNDVEPSVRFSTVQALAAQNEAPELAVPLLVSALQDKEDSVSSRAADGLAGFSTNALSAWPAITNLLASGREAQTRAALKALPAIDPANALRILTNAVLTGSPSTMGTALPELKPLAPALALNMTLAELRSNDTRRQLVALGVAGTYDPDTPGIADALKLAAKGSDPEISRHSLITMRGMLNKLREKRGPIVRIPNEPEYQGKPLAEWLTMWRDDFGLSTNALQAMRQMGTNLIPALVARLTYKDPTFGLDDYEVGMGAARALIALGNDAKPALPTLAALMDSESQDLALRAMISTLGTGTDAIPCLLKGFTNRFADIRSEAAHFMTEWGAQFPQQQKQAVPYVIRLLEDPEHQVRMNATNNLLELDPQTAVRMGIKPEGRPRPPADPCPRTPVF
jgi:HEAT repeat protein